MKAYKSRKGALFILSAVTASFSLFAEGAAPFNLGSADPGLRIIYDAANQYSIYLIKPLTTEISDIHSNANAIYPFHEGPPKRQIILMSTERSAEGEPEILYPYDEQTAFTCKGGPVWAPDGNVSNYQARVTQVFSRNPTNVDGLLVSKDVYAMARSQYSLTTNELFLGKIGTNIYYWEMQDPSKVYYRFTKEKQAANYFKLPKGVFDLDGVTKAVSTSKDVGVCAAKRSSGWFNNAAANFTFIEVSFKNAKQVEGNQ